jgi:hypothetical protein
MHVSIRLLGLATLVCAFTAMSAHSEEATSESIRRLLNNTGAGDLGVQVLDQMLPALRQMAPEASEEFWAEVTSEVRPEDLINMVVPVYQNHLTEEDVLKINEFYESDVGKRLVGVLPQIQQESMQMGQQWGQDLARRIIGKLQAQQPAESQP